MNTVDAIGVVKFFNDFHGQPYCSPQKATDVKVKRAMLELRENAKKAQEQFNVIVTELAAETYLTEILNKNFLDGTRVKTRSYYWGQLKSGLSFLSPESISIFCEWCESEQKAKYRVSLEIDDRNSSEEGLKLHNKFIENIDCPGTTDIYLSRNGYDKNYCLRSKIDKNEWHKYPKLLLSQNIYVENKTDDEVLKELVEAVKTLLPLYKKIIKYRE